MKYIIYLAFCVFVTIGLVLALIIVSNEIYNPPVCAADAARRRKVRQKVISIMIPIGFVVILARILIH